MGKRRGRPKKYGKELAEVLEVIWEASDRLCSRRLPPFLKEMVRILKQHREVKLTVEIEKQLLELSSSTIDRLLRPWRQPGKRRSFSTTRPGNLLKRSIPIRTFADWQDSRPGFFEVDLVSHYGESADGFYLTTLTVVDVATGWSECIGVLGKGQERIGSAVHHLRQRLPFPLLGLDSDNGSEFINQHLYRYCHREGHHLHPLPVLQEE